MHGVQKDAATSWTAAHQASLSITSSQSLLRLMSIKSVMPYNHLILCRPLLLLPSIFPTQAWKPGSQHAGEKRGVAGLLLGRTDHTQLDEGPETP